MKKAGLLSLIMMALLSGCVDAHVTQSTDVAVPSENISLTEALPNLEMTEPTEDEPTEAVTSTEEAWVTGAIGDGETTLTLLENLLPEGKYAEDVIDAYADEPWFTFRGVPNKLTEGDDVYSFQMIEGPVEEGVGDQTPNWPDVVIMKNDQQIASSPLGAPSNMNPIWAFVVSDGDWYLEIFRGEQAVDEDGKEWPVGGDILMNGNSLNEVNGYDDSFGLHLVSGKPIYFFVRDGAYGYVYNGFETALDYSDISHHRCCSAGLANPRGSDDRVVIFASRGDQLYMVMIGDFE